MTLTWTSPEQVPGIQRWGVLPVFFCAAGALGGAGGELLCRAVPWLETRTYDPWIWALVDGCAGLAIGVSVVFGRKGWMRVALAPILGAASLMLGATLYRAWHGDYESLSLRQLLEDTRLRGSWLFEPAALVAAHGIWLWRARAEGMLRRGVAVYVLAGSLSGVGAAWMVDWRCGASVLATGAVDGAAGGIAQLVAMAAAQAFSGVRPLEEGGAP